MYSLFETTKLLNSNVNNMINKTRELFNRVLIIITSELS